MKAELSGDADSGTADIWVIFYDDEGKKLSFGNVGKVTDWISRWKTWRGNSKLKRPYIDGKVKFLNIFTVFKLDNLARKTFLKLVP